MHWYDQKWSATFEAAGVIRHRAGSRFSVNSPRSDEEEHGFDTFLSVFFNLLFLKEFNWGGEPVLCEHPGLPTLTGLTCD